MIAKYFSFIVFLFLNAFLFLAKNVLVKLGIDFQFLLAANAILFLLSVIVSLFHAAGLRDPNPNVFVRAMIGSLMLKMFLVAAMLLVYALYINPKYDMGTILITLAIYVFYLIAEVFTVLKKNKTRNV